MRMAYICSYAYATFGSELLAFQSCGCSLIHIYYYYDLLLVIGFQYIISFFSRHSNFVNVIVLLQIFLK